MLDEALNVHGAKLIVTYHPRPFGKFNKLTRDDTTQRIVLRCARAGVAVYSPHTACDNCAIGVNDWLAEAFATDPSLVTPIEACKLPDFPGAGSGRIIKLAQPLSLQDAVEKTKVHLGLQHVRLSICEALLPGGASAQQLAEAMQVKDAVRCVGVQAGSGGGVLRGCGADLWLTGECGHHDVLAAAAEGVSVILTDHTNTERGFLQRMSSQLREKLNDSGTVDVEIVISSRDADPLQVV